MSRNHRERMQALAVALLESPEVQDESPWAGRGMDEDRAAGWLRGLGTQRAVSWGTEEAVPGGKAVGVRLCVGKSGGAPGFGKGTAVSVAEELATGTKRVAVGRRGGADLVKALTDAKAQAAEWGTDFLRSPVSWAAPGIAVASSLPRGSGYPYQGSACGVGSKFPGAVGGLAELVARDLLGNVALHVWWVLRSAEQASPGLPGGVSSLAGATPAVSFCFQNAVRSAPRTLI